MITFWTIYEHPKTVGMYIAMRSVLPSEPDELIEIADRAGYVLSSDLSAIRTRLSEEGLSCYGRDPEDQPYIVEVWLKGASEGVPEQKSGRN